MAERKASNKYYPPQWTPDQGSLNTFHGSHPLRERARKLDQGIMIIRFELPYNIWCNGCGSHVGMGVRYNAQKTTVGKYYSTPIFKFRMKCHLCDNHFEIQTDPKNCDYVVVSGASRKNEKWEHTEGETVSVAGASEAEKLATDPMYRLEHSAQDRQKAEEAAPRIARIMAMQEQYKDDFDLNQLMRKKFRGEKAELKKEAEEDRALQDRASVSVPLVREREEDIVTAKAITFSAGSSREERKRKRLEINTQPLFGAGRKKERLSVMKVCGKMGSGVLRGGGGGGGGGGGAKSGGMQKLRNSLGVRTTHKS